MMRILTVLGLGALAVYLMRRTFGRPTELGTHLLQQRNLQATGAIATTAANGAATTVPLATLGTLPMAGLSLSPISDSIRGFLDGTAATISSVFDNETKLAESLNLSPPFGLVTPSQRTSGAGLYQSPLVDRLSIPASTGVWRGN